MVQRVVTVNDVLGEHVVLDIECLDQIYLNAYVPILQTSSQVVAFLSGHLGFPCPSPVLFRQLGARPLPVGGVEHRLKGCGDLRIPRPQAPRSCSLRRPGGAG